FFHRTTQKTAKIILSEGFKDRRDRYMTDVEHEGVFVSDCPLGPCEGAWGGALLSIEFNNPPAWSDYEWIEDGKPYREWLVPAAEINGKAIVTIQEDEYDSHCGH